MAAVRGWNWRAIAFALALLAATPAGADAPPTCEGKDLTDIAGLVLARAKRADDLIDGEGILWRIDKAGLAPSYLYGTIHSTDDSAIALARRAAERISGAKIVATELGSMDAVEKANISTAILTTALDRDHDTFEGVPESDRAGIETFAAAQGFPSEFAHHLKLWFLAILTAMPACETKRQALGPARSRPVPGRNRDGLRRQSRWPRNRQRADRRRFDDASGDRGLSAVRRRARA